MTATLAIVALGACGGSGGGGASGPTTPSGTGPGPSGATITISSGAVSPSQVTIAVGQSVTFVNNGSRSHDMTSDPHPSHTNCPSINAVGVLAAGQTRLTSAFAGTGSCGFHDHNDPDNNALKGRITIQ